MTTVQIIPPRVPYAVVVQEDEATDGTRVYVAEVPDLPGCMSHGDTPQEALQNLQEAIDLYLSALEEAGVPRPLGTHPPYTSGTEVDAIGAPDVTSRYEVEGQMTSLKVTIPA